MQARQTPASLPYLERSAVSRKHPFPSFAFTHPFPRHPQALAAFCLCPSAPGCQSYIPQAFWPVCLPCNLSWPLVLPDLPPPPPLLTSNKPPPPPFFPPPPRPYFSLLPMTLALRSILQLQTSPITNTVLCRFLPTQIDLYARYSPDHPPSCHHVRFLPRRMLVAASPTSLCLSALTVPAENSIARASCVIGLSWIVSSCNLPSSQHHGSARRRGRVCTSAGAL